MFVPFAGQHHHLGRETFLAPVIWSSDGWPVIGNDGRVAEKMNARTLRLDSDESYSSMSIDMYLRLSEYL